MLATNRYALKEWSSVCDRLAAGEQVLLLRKGGLRERRPGFEVEHREFFLFPTRYHQEGGTPGEKVELGLYARVEEAVKVDDLAPLRRLEGQHSVPWEDVERRFHYGREKGVHVLAVRAYRLPAPHVIENAPSYSGCVSWVELERELPAPDGEPVLPAPEFLRKIDRMQAALDG